ncbi:MAG TPA: hypothetical protein DIT58_07120 [Porticoccaceae bacterium]|nr:hypothetical protein [Porticoccaceae bacterium]
MSRTPILSGIKVVDFTHIVAGPHCTRLMAEQGAEVIKIEPLTGDPIRTLPFHKEGRSACFIQHNIGKMSMAMDISTPEAREILYQLIKDADVVVENFAPGVMKRHKLDWETLSKLNPDLIMCSISCFGQTGPLAEQPGYDFIGQSYAGVLDMNGEPDGNPIFPDLAFGDVSTGAHAYGAIVAALFHKFRGHGGQYIDISLVDVLFSYHEMAVELYDGSGEQIVLKRQGAHHALVAPLGIYPCADRHLFIIASRDSWVRLVKLIGRPDLLEDPRCAEPMARNKNRDLVNAAIQKWLDDIDDADEAIERLHEHRVPAAPILSIPEVMSHPHIVARGTVRNIPDPVFGQIRIPNNPLRFSQFPEPLDIQAGFLGDANHAILKERLNYTDHQIEDLENRGIITSKRI